MNNASEVGSTSSRLYLTLFCLIKCFSQAISQRKRISAFPAASNAGPVTISRNDNNDNNNNNHCNNNSSYYNYNNSQNNNYNNSHNNNYDYNYDNDNDNKNNNYNDINYENHMNFSGKSFAFSKSGNIPDIVNVKPSHSPNSSSPFQHLKNTVSGSQIIDKNFYDNNDDNQYSPINKDSMGYGDDDDKDREENNLSFEQLKNELIIHKRKKKDSKKVKINEATDKVVKSVLISTEAECTIRFVGEETPADTDDYWRMISLLEPFKQKAKTVVQLFLPSIHTLRKFLRVRTRMRRLHIV